MASPIDIEHDGNVLHHPFGAPWSDAACDVNHAVKHAATSVQSCNCYFLRSCPYVLFLSSHPACKDS